MEAEGPITCLAASVRPGSIVSLLFVSDWFVYRASRTMPGLPEAPTRTCERTSRVNMTCPGLSPQTLEEMLSDRPLLIRTRRESRSHLSALPHMSPTSAHPQPCNSDKPVKVIDLQDTKKIVLLEGHSRGVRRAAWHPSGTLLVRLNP
jgi:WD40 repeat protein